MDLPITHFIDAAFNRSPVFGKDLGVEGICDRDN